MNPDSLPNDNILLENQQIHTTVQPPDTTMSKYGTIKLPKRGPPLIDEYTIFRGDTHANSIKLLQERIAFNQSQGGGASGFTSGMKPIL
jgi:hypothetical protein